MLCSHQPRERDSRCKDWCRIWQKAGRAGGLLLAADGADSASDRSTALARSRRLLLPLLAPSSSSASPARDGGRSATAAAAAPLEDWGPSVGEETGEEPEAPPPPLPVSVRG